MQSATASRTAAFSNLSQTIPGRVIVTLAATLFVSLAARIAIPLPFTPVPLIMTPLAVLGVGLALGPVAGFVTMLAYLLEGAAGLPVFSPTGPGGILQLFGPTGGYLLSYPLVAAVAGYLTALLAGRLPRFTAALIGCSAAVVILFCMGAAWFLHIVPSMSAHTVWVSAVAPFLPGEAVKVLAAAGIYSTLTRHQRA